MNPNPLSNFPTGAQWMMDPTRLPWIDPSFLAMGSPNGQAPQQGAGSAQQGGSNISGLFNFAKGGGLGSLGGMFGGAAATDAAAGGAGAAAGGELAGLIPLLLAA